MSGSQKDPRIDRWVQAIAAAMAMAIATWVGNNIDRMTHSIESLNEKMVQVVEKVNSHERRIELLEIKRGK